MDIKAWLEKAGEPVAETCFPPGSAPPLPYIYYRDDADHGGADMKNILTTHNLTVERYSETAEYNAKLEALFDAAGLQFTREQMWLPDPDDMYETVYTLKTSIFERTDI
ncbi:MAG TPA: hypothetical protein DG942_01575 [Ruminococcaceae bacterium]|jgi:hypothetical protein|nr:hypothetical protein [Oscillospiraceae bacterium]